jgi:tetratricopeptide (TPR) repeat protein
MNRPALFACIAALAACGSKSSAPPGGSGAPTAQVASGAPVDARPVKPAAPAKPARPAPTKAQRADYRAHLAAGRKLGNAKRWGEAVGEFEAALKAVPLDGRALAELGLAAYAAGDFKKARKANNDATRVAGDPKVRAASFYNLGLVAEAEHDVPAAAAAYAASLALRPGNATVTQALAKLGTAVSPDADDAAPQACTTPTSIAKLCACLVTAAAAGPADPDAVAPTCAEATDAPIADDVDVTADAPPGFAVLVLDDHEDHEQHVYLAAAVGKAWVVAGDLGGAYNPGMFGINESYALKSLALRKVGPRQVLWIETHREHSDSDPGLNEEESTATDSVILCPVGDAAAPTRCALTVLVAYDYDRDILLSDDEPGIVHTKGLPLESHARLAINLGNDGVATVTLKTGTAPDRAGLLGPHKLW